MVEITNLLTIRIEILNKKKKMSNRNKIDKKEGI